jgi:hypothetical protein
LSDGLDARNKVRNNSERRRGTAAGASEVAVPRAATVVDAVTPAAVSASIRADMRRALAEGLTRALAAGDDKAARIAIVALSGLMDDVADAAPVVDAAAIDPVTKRRR